VTELMGVVAVRALTPNASASCGGKSARTSFISVSVTLDEWALAAPRFPTMGN